jgi:flap endonuclease-1
MGIQGLAAVLDKIAKNATKKMHAADLAGWRIGFDASMVIYQMAHVGRTQNLVNADGQPIYHLLGLFLRVVNILKLNIIPTFIFDGPPPAIKAHTMAKRRKAEEKAGFDIPRSAFADCMHLLNLMGVETVQAPSEAESQASIMTRLDLIDAVASEDGDVLTFNATRQIRGLTGSTTFVNIITTDDIYTLADLTRGQFIDLCILLGSDYTATTLPGIGKVRAIERIRKYHTIEKILASEKIIPPPDFTFAEARAEFERPTANYDIVLNGLKPANINGVKEFLLSKGIIEAKLKKSLDVLSELIIAQ